MSRGYLTSILMATCCSLAVAQSVPDPKRYTELNHRIFFHRASGQDEKTFRFPSEETTDEITKELHDMVATAIQQALLAPEVSSESVRKAMSDLQGEDSLSSLSTGPHVVNPRAPNVPFADLSHTNGVPTVLAAFAVVRGGGGIPQVRAYLQFYSQIAGEWRLQAESGSDLDRTAFSVARVKSGASNESWYLVWGSIFGNTGARGKIRLYGFDAYSVRTLWQNDDLTDATITVSQDRVTIEHYVVRPEGLLIPPRHLVEVMRATVNGLVPESSRTLEK